MSRSTVFEFKSVTAEEILPAVERAFRFLENEKGITINCEDGVARYIAYSCGGDVRKAMNACELCLLSTNEADGAYTITLERAKALTQAKTSRSVWGGMLCFVRCNPDAC